MIVKELHKRYVTDKLEAVSNLPKPESRGEATENLYMNLVEYSQELKRDHVKSECKCYKKLDYDRFCSEQKSIIQCRVNQDNIYKALTKKN